MKPIDDEASLVCETRKHTAPSTVLLNVDSMRALALTAGSDSSALPLPGAAPLLSCLWTVNEHQNTGLFAQLSSTLQSGFSDRTTTLYPGTRGGFIGSPTELLQMLPTAALSTPLGDAGSAAGPSRGGGQCGQVTNNTASFESSYNHVAAASTEACCGKYINDVACDFGCGLCRFIIN
jgi:hypothetical protein